MLVPLLLLWPLSVALTWLISQNIANKPHDRELEYLVQAVAREVVRLPDGPNATRVGLDFPLEALLVGQADGHRQVQVLGLNGELVVGNAALPLPPQEVSAQEPVYRGTVNDRILLADIEVDDVPMRVAWMWLHERVERSGEQPPLVQVAETLGERSLLATEVLKGVLLPQYAILPLAVLLVWMALSRGLAPLEVLQRRIRARRSQDLSPIDPRDAPEEVTPLVNAVNDLLSRLEQSVATQKRFLADAAHQLKTPLAGLRMQAELAQREMLQGQDAQQARRSLQQIARASQNATRMVNQLLAMARAEDPEQALRRQRVDLQAIALETVEDFVQRALDLRIDLGYEASPPPPRARAAAADGPAGAHPRAAAQLGGQRPDLHTGRRHRHGSGAARLLRARGGAAGGGQWRGHSRGRARARLPALLPGLGDRGRWLGPGAGHRARNR